MVSAEREPSEMLAACDRLNKTKIFPAKVTWQYTVEQHAALPYIV